MFKCPVSYRLMARDTAAVMKALRITRAQSPTPQAFDQIEKRIERMWATQPHLTAARLRTITVPVWIVDGDRNEIARSDSDFMSSAIPLGKELILPGATHYALWQYPQLFDASVLEFLSHP